jgi:signal transduction histidine kinase
VKRKLRVLVAEDSEDDYELLLLDLAHEYELVHRRVDTPEAMRSALEESWDLVLCDWSMPRFSALEALGLMRELEIEAPCIIASGTIGEDVAVEALRNGARDFLVKDQLARLRPAVDRELREAAMRSERNKMRQQLVIADHMASVGMLAGGLAHEVNNPLAAVMSNLEVALLELKADDVTKRVVEIREALTDAYTAAQRIRDIIRDVRVFSRGADDRRAPLDVGSVITSVVRMAHNEIRHRATLVLDLAPVPMVVANEPRLCQVILNLIINAAQSIAEGRADKNQITVGTRLDDRGRVTIEVIDTGCGIPAPLIDRVFTPFYTTRDVGSGTGLGLAICHRIVTDLGGEITVDSRVGHGTTFRVFLPPVASVPAAMARPHALTSSRGRILIVDDDAIVARGLARVLREMHEVEVTEHAAEALALIEQGQRFDVILCDLMMPEITGAELHAELTKIAPGQAAAMIFMTGGAFTPAARAFLARVDNPRLDKPFELADLTALIAARLAP